MSASRAGRRGAPDASRSPDLRSSTSIMFAKPMRLVGALLAAAFLAGPLAAQDATITDYSPKQITTGTMVTITGDFAEATEGKIPKPKVFGTSEDTKAKIILKVVSNSDTEIVAEVKKIPTNKKNPAAGSDWTLNVQPKGKGAFGATTSMDVMTVVGPTVVGVNPSSAMPGEEITVNIANPGAKNVKASIGGKKTKLKRAPDTEEGSGTAFTAKVPKSLANGGWDVMVDNKIGTDNAPAALVVTGSTKKLGKAHFTASINGAPYKSTGKFLGSEDSGLSIVIAANLKQNNPQRSFAVVIPFNTGTDMAPQTYAHFPTTLMTFSYSETTLMGLVPTITTWQAPNGGAASVTVNAVSGGQAAGSFEAMLVSAGQPDLDITGTFIVDL